MNKIVGTVAVIAASAPIWVPSLSDFNQLLTTISLIAGIVWIGLQIYRYLKTKETK